VEFNTICGETSMSTALSVVLLALLVVLVSCKWPPHAANEGLPASKQSTNPLWGVKWGHWLFPANTNALVKQDSPSAYYWTAKSPPDRDMFAKIALTPRARLFGQWYNNKPGSSSNIETVVSDYVKLNQNGDGDVGVMVTSFGIVPWEGNACDIMKYAPSNISAASIAQYYAWVDLLIKGLGNAPAVVVVQPDIRFADCDPSGLGKKYLVPQVKETVRRFALRRRTTVYVDATDTDWWTPQHAAAQLMDLGIEFARGFSIGWSHYTSDNDNYWWGVDLINELNKRGVKGKHFVADRSYNGRAFRYQDHGNQPRVCNNDKDTFCLAIGKAPYIPKSGPCDGYIHFGLPWQNNTSQRTYDSLLGIISSSPYLNEFPPPSPLLNDPKAKPVITCHPTSFYWNKPSDLACKKGTKPLSKQKPGSKPTKKPAVKPKKNGGKKHKKVKKHKNAKKHKKAKKH